MARPEQERPPAPTSSGFVFIPKSRGLWRLCSRGDANQMCLLERSGMHSRIGSGAETARGDTSVVWLLALPQAGSGAFSSWEPSQPAVSMALSVSRACG